MGISSNELERILQLIDRFDYDNINIEVDDLKLNISKGRAMPYADEDLEPHVPEQHTEEIDTALSLPRSLKETGERRDLTSPLLGTFYRRPSPNDPPFVEVGSIVAPEDTVCLVEVMKLFNSVPAGITGKITEILAEDGELVEFGQPVFRIAPLDDDPS